MKEVTAGPAYEFKSVMRIFNVGDDYISAADFLAQDGLDGWQLVTVIGIRAKLTNEVGEIFYLQRQKTGP